MRSINAFTLALAIPLLLSACQTETVEPAEPDPTQPDQGQPDVGQLEPVASPSADGGSILRPDVEAEAGPEVVAPLESYTATIGFPRGGSELDAQAIDALQEVAASRLFALETPIILRAHSDSGGSDAVNARASETRGLAVAEWLIQAGADPERIEVLVFGEQNPVEPNALPDSTPNEEGRAANRRVEIEILTPASEAEKAPSEPSDES